MADKIVAEYTVKVDSAVKNLNKLASRVDKVDKERKKTQAGFKTMSKSMVSSFAEIGAAIGLAFGTQQLISFGKEAVKLAANAEGIERAFKRIGSADLLRDLRTATRGTVNDLDLMKKAVQASNFKVPLDQLAGLFKFAAARARETGEDVDFLVNSIVLGIGRKSPLILDNLGISAVELRTRLKGVGVEAANVADIAAIVGDIATEELAKMGEQADTTADKIAQVSAELINAQVAIGKGLIQGVDGLTDAITGLSIAEQDAADSASIYEGATAALGGSIRFTLASYEAMIRVLSEFGGAIGEVFKQIGLVNGELEETPFEDWGNDAERASELLRETGDVYVYTIRNLAFLNKAIKDLTEERLRGNMNIERTKELNKELNALTEERIHLLGGLTAAEKKAAKAAEDAAKRYARALKDTLKFDDDDNFNPYGEELKDMPVEVERATSIADDLWNAHFANLMAAQDEAYANERRNIEENEELFRASIDSTMQLWATFTNLAANLSEQQYTRQLNALTNALEKEQITREEFDRQKAQLAKENAKKQKEFAIIQAVINTALGVTNAFATAPNIILGAVLAAVVAATGAAEIATIASQPVPSFAEGGWVDGKGFIHGRSHASGGVRIEAEGDEHITKGRFARPNAAILEAINSGGWEKYKMENIITPAINQVLDGGFENMGASYMLNNNFNDRNLLRQGDRNRKSERDSAKFIVEGIVRGIASKSKDRYV